MEERKKIKRERREEAMKEKGKEGEIKKKKGREKQKKVIQHSNLKMVNIIFIEYSTLQIQ